MSDSGVTGALPYNPTDYCVLASCTALAWAFAIELDITIITVFPRRNGIYFWSLLLCSWGCILHALGFILKFLVGTSPLIYLCFVEIGWVAMVSGQAFVLYSRLNLVIQNKNLLRAVLAAIIIDGIALHTPVLIFICGVNSPHLHIQKKWVGKFNTMERIQLVGFSIQESVLSGLYIVATVKLLAAVFYERTRRAMMQLLLVNFICIAMDAVLVGLEFSHNYFGEASAKPLIYAIKLKLEFAVYSQLVGITKETLAQEEDLNSISHHGHSINTPADFFKSIPNLLAKPPIPDMPTVHTHPEQVKLNHEALERPKLRKEWGSSQIELTANSIAAALTTSGGRGGKSARNLMGDAPADEEYKPAAPSVRFEADGRSQTGEVPKEWSGIYMA